MSVYDLNLAFFEPIALRIVWRRCAENRISQQNFETCDWHVVVRCRIAQLEGCLVRWKFWVVWLRSHLRCSVVDSEWVGTWSSSRISSNTLYRWSETNQFQPYARVVVAPVMESVALLFGLLGILDIFHMYASIPRYHGKAWVIDCFTSTEFGLFHSLVGGM